MFLYLEIIEQVFFLFAMFLPEKKNTFRLFFKKIGTPNHEDFFSQFFWMPNIALNSKRYRIVHWTEIYQKIEFGFYGGQIRYIFHREFHLLRVYEKINSAMIELIVRYYPINSQTRIVLSVHIFMQYL